jgi:hypothetical protein
MRSTIAAAVAALVILAPSAFAEPYRNEAKQFELTLPPRWLSIPGDGSKVDLIMISPRFKTTFAMCLVASKETPESRGMSQEELNKQIAEEVTDDFYRSVYGQSGKAKDFTVASRDEMRGDRRVNLATIEFTLALKRGDTRFQGEISFFAIPGHAYLGQCAGFKEQIAEEAADFKTVMDTFNPMGPGTIAAITPPTQVRTLSARRTSTEATVLMRQLMQAQIERLEAPN